MEESPQDDLDKMLSSMLPPTPAESTPTAQRGNDHDAKLALELVSNLRPRSEVAAAYGYDTAQLKAKIANDSFRAILLEAKRLWSADTNSRDRARLKAGMLVEDSLLDIYEIVTDRNATPAVRNQSFQNLAKVAGLDQPNKHSDAGGLRIVFNMPDGVQEVSLPAIDMETD